MDRQCYPVVFFGKYHKFLGCGWVPLQESDFQKKPRRLIADILSGSILTEEERRQVPALDSASDQWGAVRLGVLNWNVFWSKHDEHGRRRIQLPNTTDVLDKYLAFKKKSKAPLCRFLASAGHRKCPLNCHVHTWIQENGSFCGVDIVTKKGRAEARGMAASHIIFFAHSSAVEQGLRDTWINHYQSLRRQMREQPATGRASATSSSAGSASASDSPGANSVNPASGSASQSNSGRIMYHLWPNQSIRKRMEAVDTYLQTAQAKADDADLHFCDRCENLDGHCEHQLKATDAAPHLNALYTKKSVTVTKERQCHAVNQTKDGLTRCENSVYKLKACMNDESVQCDEGTCFFFTTRGILTCVHCLFRRVTDPNNPNGPSIFKPCDYYLLINNQGEQITRFGPESIRFPVPFRSDLCSDPHIECLYQDVALVELHEPCASVDADLLLRVRFPESLQPFVTASEYQRMTKFLGGKQLRWANLEKMAPGTIDPVFVYGFPADGEADSATIHA
eukprot:ANDGO_01336.mRNA.1 hypothetical protein